MNFIDQDALSFIRCIDSNYEPEKSIVLRYLKAFRFGATAEEDSNFRDWIKKTSIEEGSRIFPVQPPME